MPKLIQRAFVVSLLAISGCVGTGAHPFRFGGGRRDSAKLPETDPPASSSGRVARTVSHLEPPADEIHPADVIASDHISEPAEPSVRQPDESGDPTGTGDAMEAGLMPEDDSTSAGASPSEDSGFEPLPASSNASQVTQLNLPTVLASVDQRHPVVGFARWRVRQAYADHARAKALWLPSIQAGFGFHRHDGNYQASNGAIVDVDRNSFQYGLGVGATGAGTTPRPGLVAQFHLADAIFQPQVTEKTAWARGHQASAALNDQLLTAGLAYLALLDAFQQQRIVEQSIRRHIELATITIDFADVGQGLRADADRLRTEVVLTQNRLAISRERSETASARLAEAISIDSSDVLLPMDSVAIPLEMVSPEIEKSALISQALAARPELKASQSLVRAACEAHRREKYAPFIPSVLLGFSTGGFGGGLGNELDDVSDRYDFDALMSWQVRNLGFGERAARQQTSAQLQQAQFEQLRLMDRVAREVAESFAQVRYRRQRLEITEKGIRYARDSYRRNMERIRDGNGLPLEVLQSAQALEAAEQAYATAVVSHNEAQLRLQWALGWSICDIPTDQMAIDQVLIEG